MSLASLLWPTCPEDLVETAFCFSILVSIPLTSPRVPSAVWPRFLAHSALPVWRGPSQRQATPPEGSALGSSQLTPCIVCQVPSKAIFLRKSGSEQTHLIIAVVYCFGLPRDRLGVHSSGSGTSHGREPLCREVESTFVTCA